MTGFMRTFRANLLQLATGHLPDREHDHSGTRPCRLAFFVFCARRGGRVSNNKYSTHIYRVRSRHRAKLIAAALPITKPLGPTRQYLPCLPFQPFPSFPSLRVTPARRSTSPADGTSTENCPSGGKGPSCAVWLSLASTFELTMYCCIVSHHRLPRLPIIESQCIS